MTTRQFLNRGSVSGLFIGGLIGAGTALLFAPGSGKDTRRRIGHYAGEVRDKTGGYVSRGKDAVLQAYGKGAKYLENGTNLLSGTIEAGKKAYQRSKEGLTR